MARNVGNLFLAHLAAGEFGLLETLLSPEVHFRCMTPGGLSECRNNVAAIDFLRGWFGPTRVEKTQPISGAPYPFMHTTRMNLLEGHVGRPVSENGHRVPIRYLLDLENEKGHTRCEQQGYYTEVDGKITKIDLVCSGILPYRI